MRYVLHVIVAKSKSVIDIDMPKEYLVLEPIWNICNISLQSNTTELCTSRVHVKCFIRLGTRECPAYCSEKAQQCSSVGIEQHKYHRFQLWSNWKKG